MIIPSLFVCKNKHINMNFSPVFAYGTCFFIYEFVSYIMQFSINHFTVKFENEMNITKCYYDYVVSINMDFASGGRSYGAYKEDG